jgi:hypothetical protein
LAHTPRQSGVARAPASLILGVAANMRWANRQDRCRVAGMMHATGVGWTREDLSWNQIEPQRGVYKWERFDVLLRFAAKHGITVLPIIDDTPKWAGPAAGALPSTIADYTTFVTTVVRRYGPGGEFWRAQPHIPTHPIHWIELYNEPYLTAPDPGSYALLVRATVQAAQGVVPGLHFLAEADAGAWMAGMYAAVPDIFHYVSAVAVHPYSIQPPDAPPAQSTTRRLELVHATMAAHGDGAVPLWITEIGWSTCPASPYCVNSERVQADYLAQALRLAGTTWSSYVRAMFVFGLREYAPRRPGDKESWFGLLRPDYSPKPAWGVLAAAAAR